jgi:hypothetical protein
MAGVVGLRPQKVVLGPVFGIYKPYRDDTGAT